MHAEFKCDSRQTSIGTWWHRFFLFSLKSVLKAKCLIYLCMTLFMRLSNENKGFLLKEIRLLYCAQTPWLQDHHTNHTSRIFATVDGSEKVYSNLCLLLHTYFVPLTGSLIHEILILVQLTNGHQLFIPHLVYFIESWNYRKSMTTTLTSYWTGRRSLTSS